jgi:NAD(P)-dependent dehydrogenase (short-subunit alcohol dehydrogenase family)
MKHALITGGNKGIGLATTQLFLNARYKVTIVARQQGDFVQNQNTRFISFDLENIEGISNLIQSLEPVDVLINNAGIMNSYTYDQYPAQEKQKLLKINLEAPIELINCVSKSMIEKKSGRIVNNTSLAGQTGHPEVWYGMAKAALINATKSYAKILGPHGILVNAIAAGPVETDMLNTIPEVRREAILKSVYSGRFAKIEEVAQTLFWLGSQSPEYINGTCIDINNGAFPR